MGLAALPIVALAVGFAVFVAVATRPPGPAVHADGIVVLTGGADRVETGLTLLAEGWAPRLLISGVARAADYPTLARLAGASPALSARVTLGHQAHSTGGNARETEAWVKQNKAASLIVVTAFYHMPRALAEMARALPGVALHPFPVRPLALAPWWGAPGAWRLLAVEYVKYLAVVSGAAPLFRPDP
jgi:uncharacterized SAM-binding protein YcdF (DUF218 family)